MVPVLPVTVRLIVVLWLIEPEVPVTVTVAVPAAAVLLAVKVSVLVLVVLAGLNDAVTPEGKPDAARLTLPEKPFCAVMLTVAVPLPPCATLRLLGAAAIAKFGCVATTTVNASVVECDSEPDVPLMLTL